MDAKQALGLRADLLNRPNLVKPSEQDLKALASDI